jgi:hypothetical protein
MRAKKAPRANKTGRVKSWKSLTTWTKTVWSARAANAWPIALIAITITAMGILVARQPSPAGEMAAATPAKPGIVTTDEAAMKQAAAPVADMPIAEPTEKAFEASPVAITGCLERDQESFKLSDTSGDVPRARSWKTGFLRKSAASIEVVDAANHVKLANHIGERVTVKGLLVNREMQVRSLQRVADSCSKSKA